MNRYPVFFCDSDGAYKTLYLSTRALHRNFKAKTTRAKGVAWGTCIDDLMFFIFDDSVVFDQLSPIIHSVIDNIDGRPHMGFTAQMKDMGGLND
jgi:hypothetical protein